MSPPSVASHGIYGYEPLPRLDYYTLHCLLRLPKAPSSKPGISNRTPEDQVPSGSSPVAGNYPVDVSSRTLEASPRINSDDSPDATLTSSLDSSSPSLESYQVPDLPSGCSPKERERWEILTDAREGYFTLCDKLRTQWSGLADVRAWAVQLTEERQELITLDETRAAEERSEKAKAEAAASLLPQTPTVPIAVGAHQYAELGLVNPWAGIQDNVNHVRQTGTKLKKASTSANTITGARPSSSIKRSSRVSKVVKTPSWPKILSQDERWQRWKRQWAICETELNTCHEGLLDARKKRETGAVVLRNMKEWMAEEDAPVLVEGLRRTMNGGKGALETIVNDDGGEVAEVVKQKVTRAASRGSTSSKSMGRPGSKASTEGRRNKVAEDRTMMPPPPVQQPSRTSGYPSPHPTPGTQKKRPRLANWVKGDPNAISDINTTPNEIVNTNTTSLRAIPDATGNAPSASFRRPIAYPHHLRPVPPSQTRARMQNTTWNEQNKRQSAQLPHPTVPVTTIDLTKETSPFPSPRLSPAPALTSSRETMVENETNRCNSARMMMRIQQEQWDARVQTQLQQQHSGQGPNYMAKQQHSSLGQKHHAQQQHMRQSQAYPPHQTHTRPGAQYTTAQQQNMRASQYYVPHQQYAPHQRQYTGPAQPYMVPQQQYVSSNQAAPRFEEVEENDEGVQRGAKRMRV
ncbi:MAG: hypothetical protein M1837_002563 [Sclerophora amabilis]|nr:MAG: hypothetical protein M1837_002563 [Sclerophora amabilis]